MKKLITILILSLCLINLASAYQPHEQNKDFNLVVTSNNGTACNVSIIQLPDGTSNILNRPLTKNGQTFYTTITSGNFSLIGTTCMNIVCTDSVTYETGSVCREITTDGFDNKLGFYFLIILLSFGVIIFGYYSEDAITIILGSFGLYFVGLYILFNGIDAIKDTTYTWGIGIIILCLAFYFSFRASSELLGD